MIELNPSQIATVPVEERLPQGVSPRILLDHVRNTAPFIFEWHGDVAPYIRNLQNVARALETNPELTLDHAPYYELCVSAHWATVATFVPTDVDNQIRFRLWNPALDSEKREAMVRLVEEAREWPVTAVTTRWVQGPESKFILSGHNGEWFSISAGAYGSLRKTNPERAKQIAEQILDEVKREAAVFEEFRRLKDGINALKAATLIAHNLGDLDRVFEMWNIPEDEPIRGEVKALTEKGTSLWTAGELNRTTMAIENHRHFALRKPKVLRKSSDFLLPIGPFFDDWGKMIASHPLLSPEEVGDIAEALVDGWVFLKEPVGYARAIAGIEEKIGLKELCSLLPSRIAKTLKTGLLRQQITVPQARFEASFRSRGIASH